MPSSAEDVARSYFDAIGRRDLDGIVSHYSDDVVVDALGQGISRGPKEMREFFAAIFDALPDSEMLTDRVLGGDGVAVVEWRLRGNFTGGPLFGIDPTDVWIEQRGCDVLEIEDGKILRNTAYQDGIEMLRQIGMMAPLDSPAERGLKQAFNLATRARKALKQRFG
jgi:steroid delta-isomerase-like uncharacterized protein